MTRKIGNVVIIEDEPDKRCSRCGAVTDCRPAGPKGSQLCMQCVTPAELRAYTRHLFGDAPEN